MTSAARITGGTPLHISRLEKHYGTRQVLNKIDLAIPAGQFVAIVGRSGCGKSTLLRLLAGLEKPDGGALNAGNGSLDDERDSTRLMFQDARLLPWKTVRDNVGLVLKGDWRRSGWTTAPASGPPRCPVARNSG
ncbi:Aliphatic sulfonates import ATP-binding protein SsuB [Sodalis praecaptivus]|nr:Aliphatic sulfonates import ATP-binding protein SsuB [Sodalis praecaptivus]